MRETVKYFLPAITLENSFVSSGLVDMTAHSPPNEKAPRSEGLYTQLELVAGIEPASGVYKTLALPFELHKLNKENPAFTPGFQLLGIVLYSPIL